MDLDLFAQGARVGTWIEFQNYSRSEMDLPPMQGKWDYKESRIWVNDQEITAPRMDRYPPGEVQ